MANRFLTHQEVLDMAKPLVEALNKAMDETPEGESFIFGMCRLYGRKKKEESAPDANRKSFKPE